VNPLVQTSGTLVIAVDRGGLSLGAGLLNIVRVRVAAMLPALLLVVPLWASLGLAF